MFYDVDGEVIGSVNRLDGQIQIEASYSSRIQIQTSLISNRPIINLIDTVKNIRLFTISPLHRDTVIQSNNGNFSLVTLPSNNYGQFGG